MAKSGNQKGKLLYLAEIFHRETDEAHGLTLAELTERLAAYGVQAERKTLYADMEELRQMVGVLRAERQLTRAQLATLIDVNPQTVGALERGDHYPSLDLAFRICDVFDLPVEAVFSREPFTPLSTALYRKDQGGKTHA